jgi:hypothetical protein
MSAYKTTAPSSANVIRLNPPPLANTPKAATPTFQQAREAWLDRWHFDHRLSDADRAFCTQLYLHFNRLHYEATGELMAWPSWETLRAKAGRLTKSAAFRRLRHLEQLGAVEIEHGRYDHKAKQRAGNRYRARGACQGCIAATLLRLFDQGCISDQSKVAPLTHDSLTRDSLNRDSLNLDSSKNDDSVFSSEGELLARPEGEFNKSPSPSNSFTSTSPPSEEGVPRAAALGDVPRAAHRRWQTEREGDAATRESDVATLERYRRKALGEANGGTP